MNAADAQTLTSTKPIRLAIAGMTHGHVAFFLGRKTKGDFVLSGVYEPHRELALQLSKKYGFDPKLIYDDLGKMLDEVKPEAVVAFGSIYEHAAVVEACAPRGVNVMVEKPLATTVEQAERMKTLAEKYHIQLLTDYETSWYPTTEKSFQLVNADNFVGKLKKVVIHDGHQGPKEIGCDKYFLDWLTDPVQNGGGALIDFGCYGANLMTGLMHGEKPVSVTAVTKQYKPNIYPKVDDDATIIVNYPNAECIIQASWNWPFGRKDMEIYGDSGYIVTVNNNNMRLRNAAMPTEKPEVVTSKDVFVYEDPFAYFRDVLKGKITMKPYDLYALDNNVMVVKILSAARESAKTGKTVWVK
jgi:predicted dehydrogenase